MWSVNEKSVSELHQLEDWMSPRGRNEVTASPTVGTSQITEIAISARCTGERWRNLTMRALGVRGSAPTVTSAVANYEITRSLRKRRMLKAMIGMISSNITTAIAAP